ncbi:glucokinase [Tangfeifania diversioriginum]|uniref:Glucokinase n=1 Tax=Tangfeifania diversioriginum TaxID=1168035 RepID=A0A1M6HQB9_9BACT|nr:ROK family protein [Tangfeifania diversioriginum]SHJ24377.1 glucokinase [Tangfeifania diversioriginum]
MKRVAIGVDVGGTNTAIGVVDPEGNVMVKDNISTPSHGDIERYISDLADAIKELIKSVKLLNKDIEILGIGIGAPNGNYYSGTIEYAPNLSFKGVVHVVKLLRTHFSDLEAVALTNDANAAAIGEMIYGGAKDMKNFVLFTLGTGVGSGLVVNGDLVYGHDGFAGECGHTTLVPGGRMCGCTSLGHLEAYCSAPGMKRTAFELLAYYNATDSVLANKSYNELDSKMIYEAAVEGDKVALEVFEKTGAWLGQGLADTVHHLSPEAIFLFGGPTAAGDYIFKPTKKHMEKHLLPIFKDKIKILPSELKPGDAAIVGASALVWKELEK